MSSTTDTARPAEMRAHHLYCLRYYRGEGYDERFRTALDETVDTAGRAGILVVAGADGVCRACPDLAGGQCSVDAVPERPITALDELALDLLGVEPGDVLAPGSLDGRVAETLDDWRAGACTTCGYSAICAPRMEELDG